MVIFHGKKLKWKNRIEKVIKKKEISYMSLEKIY